MPTIGHFHDENYNEMFLIYFFISFVTSHFADGIFQHYVLLEEVVDRYFSLCIVMHRTFEEETQEVLGAVTAGTGCKV